MYIQTKEIGPEGLEIDRRLEFTPPPQQDDQVPLAIGEIHLAGFLQRTHGGISFEGDIGTVASMSCSRCLEAYALPLELHFDLLYTADPEPATRGESRVDEESITHARYDGARIQLDELLQEQIYLGLPLKPLCRPDCGGLCSRCGTNLNAGTCDCREERAEDPRLLTLKTLR